MLSNERGRRFEMLVRTMLDVLVRGHPSIVSVLSQPRVGLHDGSYLVPDFRLTASLPFGNQVWTIECQSRQESSNEIVHKIRALKALSATNRVMFVYEDEDFLSPATRKALDADGVLCHDRVELMVFLARLSDTLALVDDKADPKQVLQELISVLAGVGSSVTSLELAKETKPKKDEGMLGRARPY